MPGAGPAGFMPPADPAGLADGRAPGRRPPPHPGRHAPCPPAQSAPAAALSPCWFPGRADPARPAGAAFPARLRVFTRLSGAGHLLGAGVAEPAAGSILSRSAAKPANRGQFCQVGGIPDMAGTLPQPRPASGRPPEPASCRQAARWSLAAARAAWRSAGGRPGRSRARAWRRSRHRSNQPSSEPTDRRYAAVPVAMMAFWVAYFCTQLKTRPLLQTNDPHVAEILEPDHVIA